MPDSSTAADLRRRRPDESMSLLVDIATQALDPGYAARAVRRSSGQATVRGNRSAIVGAVALAATLLVVIAALQAQRGAPAAARTRDRLLAQVRAQNAAVAGLQRQLDARQAQARRLRNAVLSSTSAGKRLAGRLSDEELAAGTLAVSGPGMRVTVADDPQGRNHVLDSDLQAITNALWAAGAEALAVNGQRLTSQSAIRQAGDAILVNLQPVTAPYDVQAVGDPVAMATSFGASAAAARLRAYAQLYGLRFSYSRESRMTLPGAPGLSLRFARPTAAGGSP